jgi:thiol peroxidase
MGDSWMIERAAAVTFKGKPLTLAGKELKVGDQSPDATLVNQSQETVRLSDYAGKIILLSVVPSLDTRICSAQTKRFNEEAAGLPDSVQMITVSMDLPFAKKRFCGEANSEYR